MTLQLAKPSFATGPQDNLATQDVYGPVPSGVVNRIPNLSTQYDVDSLGVLRGGLSVANSLPLFSNTSSYGAPVWDKVTLTARLLASNPTLLNTFRSLTDSTVSAIGSLIPTGVSDAVGDAVRATVNGVSQLVSSANLTDMASVGKLINDVTGSSTYGVYDPQAQAGLVAGVIQDASRYGIPNSYGSMIQTVGDPYTRRRVAALSLPTIVQTSDVHSLSTMSDTLPPGGVNMLNPSTISDFSRQYSHPLGASATERNTQYTTTMQTFRKVDSNWDKCSRETTAGTDEALDLTQLQEGSTDFKETLDAGAPYSNNDDEQLYRLVHVYPPTTVDQELQQHFPYTSLGTMQRSSASVIDPRLLTTVDPTVGRTTTLAASSPTPPAADGGDMAVINRVKQRLGWDPRDGGDKVIEGMWQRGEISTEEYDVLMDEVALS